MYINPLSTTHGLNAAQLRRPRLFFAPAEWVPLETRIRVIQGHRKFATDTYRSAAYDFLLTFPSNHGPISHRYRDKRRFPSAIANFSHPRVFFAPLKGFPSELGIGAGVKENQNGEATRPNKTFDDIFSRLDTIHQRDNVTDRRTDRQCHIARQVLCAQEN